MLGFTEIFVDEQERWASLDRGATEIALGEVAEVPEEEGPVATIDVDDVKAERERLRRSGRRGRHRARAARGDAAASTSSTRTATGSSSPRSCRDPAGRPAGRAVHARHAPACVLLAGGSRLGVGRAAGAPLRRALGAAGRHGADRDPGLPARRRRVVPAVLGGQPGLRVRRRGDAGAVDRDRPEPARHAGSARSCWTRCSRRPARRGTTRSASASRPTARRSACTSGTASPASATTTAA